MATTPISAREWGRRQAEAAPLWTDEEWQRACALLRVRVAATVHQIADHQHEDQDDAVAPQRRAA